MVKGAGAEMALDQNKPFFHDDLLAVGSLSPTYEPLALDHGTLRWTEDLD
ncbi:predicted protein [Plenodomus lingam JN3]|uniref:Predicted protein n=1 Tax=Leptosphaeria maculans (strain JN3 / isolate v23.1.3 / race Av1-4-5-6-7-8) TaxID=985895 RepID=E4ZR61_LEPMJ|nr:predicted protein [Plenodomus lingam JN3]CBX93726.1 predicted protein [Plenodomus lingam JN3]